MKAIEAKKISGALITLCIGAIFTMFASQAHAVQNPSYIMPDDIFVNQSAMTEQQIQDFLVSRGSYLASYTIPPAFTEAGYYNGTWIGPAGSEADSTGWTASRVLYMTSQWYGINPQVIMATLFKEQSWISPTDTQTYYSVAYRLRWAMGYAYTESGIVNVCRTTTNNNPTGSCAGFAMQVDWGGYQLKANYNGSANRSSGYSPYWAGNTITLDGKAVYIGNHSTASLYRYTPHTPYSFNFVWFFNTFFVNIDYQNTIVPVYRFYNLRNSSHFYTASLVERNNIIAKWPTVYRYEGSAYIMNYASGGKTVPLYRFYNLRTGSHFFTTSEVEKNKVIALWSSTYRYEGVSWYVSESSVNAFPVYRFWNINGTHFYTASAAERDNVIARWPNIYRYEGIGFYIPGQ